MVWQNSLITYRNENGRPYAQTYLRTIHNQLAAIFNHAHKLYGLKSNPSSIAGSIGRKHTDCVAFWTREEYANFAKVAIHKPKSYQAFQVLY